MKGTPAEGRCTNTTTGRIYQRGTSARNGSLGGPQLVRSVRMLVSSRLKAFVCQFDPKLSQPFNRAMSASDPLLSYDNERYEKTKPKRSIRRHVKAEGK